MQSNKIKILVLQPKIIRKYPSLLRLKINNFFVNLLGKNIITNRIFAPLKVPISGELNYYGAITELLGAENVYYVDSVNPCFFTSTPWIYKFFDWENYPSSYGYEMPSIIRCKDIPNKIKSFDAVIASSRMGEDLNWVLTLAKLNNIPIGIIDHPDHEKIFLNNQESPFRGISEANCDILFKKDFPFRLKNKKIKPISPIPTKFENPYIYEKQSQNRKKYSVFFVGAHRDGVTRDDRKELCEIISQNFPDSVCIINGEHISSEEFNEYASSSKILLSPNGRVWDSYRHTNLAKFCRPVIIPKPDIFEAQNNFQDGVDCIMYDYTFTDGKYKLLNIVNFIEKLNKYLSDENLCKQVGEAYYNNVMKYHTTSSRAKYIIDELVNV